MYTTENYFDTCGHTDIIPSETITQGKSYKIHIDDMYIQSILIKTHIATNTSNQNMMTHIG